MSYPGAKNNSGIQQFIINNMPRHNRYFELFAGTAAIYKAKRPAAYNLLSDLNVDLIKEHKAARYKNTTVVQANAFHLLDKFDFTREDFIYLDPPYPESSRRAGRAYYKHEMLSDSDHVKLLSSILAKDANIMISTRQNELYQLTLKEWRKEKFTTVDRAGIVDEIIYMNYPPPIFLHQYNYLGTDATDRQRISRKIARFGNKINMLPAYEKHLFIQELVKNDRAAVELFLTMGAGGNSQK